ncbi:MAG: hypothetical protein ACRYFX_19830 [Janthinobacterium lividum]
MRLLSSLLLPLLLSLLLGCSKKDDATPAPAASMASYTLSGVTRTCQATAKTSVAPVTPAYDELVLNLVTTPEPASGKEYVVIYFNKAVGEPVSKYQCAGIDYFSKNSTVHARYDGGATSVTQTSSGGFSGTFTGNLVSTIPTSGSSITAGAFTDLHP